MRIDSTALACILSCLLTIPVARADVPLEFSLQGKLSGFNNESVQLLVQLYNAQSGGTLLYSELHSGVPLSTGVFSIRVGSMGGGVPLSALSGSTVWMGVSVNGQSELPRMRVVSSPFALMASHAATAFGLSATAGGIPAVLVDPDGSINLNGSTVDWNNSTGNSVIRTTMDSDFGPDPCRGGAEQEMFNYWGFLPPVVQKLSILLDTNDEEHGFDCDALIQAYDNDQNLAFEFHADRVDEAPEFSLYASHPSTGAVVETIEILPGDRSPDIADPEPRVRLRDVRDSTNQLELNHDAIFLSRAGLVHASITAGSNGPQLELFNATGTARTVEIVGTDNAADSTQGGQIKLADGAGTTMIEIDSSEGSGGGAFMQLRDADGNVTIELDAQHDGGPGRVITQQLQITGGSDLSEQFVINVGAGRPQPGQVVCIDVSNPGKLVLSSRAYDRTVAGVISGAGGINPGMLMSQKETIADGEHPVALTGRVWTWCDTSAGPIHPGDLLTTSSTAGHAMKVADHGAAQGAVIGKAMSALESGSGLVLVLVSLQ